MIFARGAPSLSRRMTALYAALFAGVMLLVIGGARIGIERYAERIISRELRVGSAVFDRIAAMRYDDLHRAAGMLAADFGFRAAAATGDAATVSSALDSLKRRMGLREAFFVAPDGTITGRAVAPAERAILLAALDAGVERGVLHLGGHRYFAVAAPVRAPMPIGWLVFATGLEAREMHDLAALSSLSIDPEIVPVDRLGPGLVVAPPGRVPPTERLVNGKRLLLQASPLEGFGGGERLALVLRYSLSDALADYTPMLWLLVALGLAGSAAAVVASGLVARRLTRPIAALDDAARAVSQGDHVQVPVTSADELGRLAVSFNRMVDDIADRERRIVHLALHDTLTNLPNRTMLTEHLGRLIAASAGGESHRIAMISLDLAGFRRVNETLGPRIGDSLLREAGGRIQAALPDAFIARLGGDEFAIVVTEDERGAERAAREATGAIARPFLIESHRILLDASAGIAFWARGRTDATALVQQADLALDRARREGAGVVRFFEAAMDAEAQARRRMEADLREALAEGQLQLYFQPLFSLGEDRVCGFEALMRWNHPTNGMIPPAAFIPLAEETGLIVPMGTWALREACAQAATWPAHMRVAVNISPVQFRSATLAQSIVSALAESGLEPSRLELEVTESLFIDDVAETLSSLHGLRTLGVRVALDDFGTGFSSLSYLRAFPFDKIKIDRSFIIDLLDHAHATPIIRAITMLAGALGMETTAEGVENAGQMDILQAEGCSQIQGYYFSRPLPADQIGRLFAIDAASARQAA